MIPHAKIRGAIRKLWLWSPMRREALKRAKWNGTKFYRCERCFLATDKPEVNHRVAVGKTPGARGAGPEVNWQTLIEKLFVGADGLEILCRTCHAGETKAQREAS
jgi:hypothetical protein